MQFSKLKLWCRFSYKTDFNAGCVDRSSMSLNVASQGRVTGAQGLTQETQG